MHFFVPRHLRVHSRFGFRSSLAALLVLWWQAALLDARAQCVAPANGLVAWWNAEGNFDNQMGTEHGTPEGGIAFTDGKVGEAFVFNGTDADLHIPIDQALNIGANPGFTIELWINPADVVQAHPLVEWNSGSFGLHLWISASPAGGGNGPGCLYADIKDINSGDHFIVSGANLIVSNVYQHVAVTYDKPSGTATLYLNGTAVAQRALGTYTPMTTGDLYFGLRPADGGAGTRYVGAMDEISLYSRTLTGSEIQSIFNAGSSGKCGIPRIVGQPVGLNAGIGQNVSFSVATTGPQDMSYQWRFNGGEISGATGNELELNNVQLTDAGDYDVVITNSYGAVTSSVAVLTVFPVSCTPPAPGLSAWWQGEENTASASGPDVAVMHGALGYTAGEVGQAFLLNGSDAFLSAGPGTNTDIGAHGSFSVEMWVSPDDASQNAPLFEWNSGGSFGVHLWTSQPTPYGTGNGCLYANIRDSSGGDHYLTTSPGFLGSGYWQHVALTYDSVSGLGTIYLDGNIIAQASVGTFRPQTTYPLFLGSRPAGAPTISFAGAMDEIALYSRALSSDEVANIHNVAVVGRCPSLPSLTAQPVGSVIPSGATFSVTVAATGYQPISYQWFFNGNPVDQATNATLVLTNVQTVETGPYFCLVSNLAGSISSTTAVLSVYAPTCVSPAGLAGWWQGEGNSQDVLGLSPLTTQGAVSYVNGLVGQGFMLTGSGTYLAGGTTTNLNVGAGGAFTAECWLSPSDLNNRPILEWNTNGNFGVHMWMSQPTPFGTGSGCLYANIRDTAGKDHYLTSPPGLVSLSGFQHVALTYDSSSSNAAIYYNGSMVVQANVGSFTPQTSFPMFWGARPAGAPTTGFAGILDEMALYNRALTTNEIQGLYLAQNAGKCPRPVQVLSPPTNSVATLSNNATFTVLAGGSQPLSYQWQFNGTNVIGATNSVFTVYEVQPSAAAVYSVSVSNSLGVVFGGAATLSVVSPLCSATPQGLVSWWPADQDPLDHFGTNNAAVEGLVSYGTGKVNSGFHFNGSTADVKVPASTTLNVGTSNGFSLDLWINPADLTDRPLVEWNTTGNYQTVLRSSTGTSGGTGAGCLFADIRDAGSVDHTIASPAGVLVSNELQHVGVTYDKASGIAALYVNGSVVARKALGTFTPATTGNLYFGYRAAGSGAGAKFVGDIDEVDLFARALTADEIQRIYNSGYVGKCKAPAVTVQPVVQTLPPMTNATFTGFVSGVRPVAYQWQLNGANLASATNSVLVLTGLQPTNAGYYTLTASNIYGMASGTGALRIAMVSIFGNGTLLTNSAYTFPASVTIQLQSFYGSGGYVFYTLDGSEPSFSSAQYNGPFQLTSNATLRVLVYSPDFQSGETDPINLTIVPGWHLTATTAGGGSINLNPPGGIYLSNTLVKVTAAPSNGWSFVQWLGDVAGTNTTNTVFMTRNKSIQAVFGTHLSTSVSGAGTLALNPAGGNYAYGTTVRITAVPQTGSMLALWGGAANGNQNPFDLTITSASPSVSALFAALSSGQATLSVIPSGHGRVTLAPAANSFPLGTQVTLTATPDSGAAFLGWSGDVSGSQNLLTFTVSQNSTVYANFTRSGPLTIGLAPGGVSEGIGVDWNAEIGATCRLDASTNLMNWTPVLVQTNVSGIIHYLDSAATNTSRRFFRGVSSN